MWLARIYYCWWLICGSIVSDHGSFLKSEEQYLLEVNLWIVNDCASYITGRWSAFARCQLHYRHALNTAQCYDWYWKQLLKEIMKKFEWILFNYAVKAPSSVATTVFGKKRLVNHNMLETTSVISDLSNHCFRPCTLKLLKWHLLKFNCRSQKHDRDYYMVMCSPTCPLVI